MQKVDLIGYLGADATIQQGKGEGKQFVSFRIGATNRRKVDRETGEILAEASTRWWSCTTNQISLAEYLKKGTMVFVSGDFGFKVYKDGDNKGQPDFMLFAQRIELLASSKKESEEKIELHVAEEVLN